MNEFEGAWITTFSGKKFHFLDPQPDEIDILDIAHALSLTCRFTGQCSEFYSVAEHSIRVAKIVPKEYRLHALLHDASEAYLPDIPRPMKAQLPEFKIMENKILASIWARFAGWYDFSAHNVVKEADNILLATEARDLMPNTNDWATLPEPLKDVIIPLTSKESEEAFLAAFDFYR